MFVRIFRRENNLAFFGHQQVLAGDLAYVVRIMEPFDLLFEIGIIFLQIRILLLQMAFLALYGAEARMLPFKHGDEPGHKNHKQYEKSRQPSDQPLFPSDPSGFVESCACLCRCPRRRFRSERCDP